MPRTLTTQDRVMLLMTLVAYLQEHGPTTVDELAIGFDVEPRTIRRLVQFLGTAGVPGETRTYQHEDLFDLDWEAFEQEDIVHLTHVVAVDDTPRFSNAETAALLAGLHVLEAMLPEEMRAVARGTAAKLAAAVPVTATAAASAAPASSAPDFEPDSATAVSADSGPAQPSLATITEAIDSGNRLSFEYRDSTGKSSARVVDPLLLGQSGGGWYLRAFCLDREAERTFLVDRMREVFMRAEHSEHAAMPSASLLGIEEAEVTALLSVRESALHRIADFAPKVLGPASPGWARVEVELLHPASAVRLVQAIPGEVVVESPPSSRLAVVEWADRALAQYGE